MYKFVWGGQDLTNKDFFIKSLSGVDTLVHIAGIMLSRPIVDVAVECNVRRLVLVHTTGIYSKYKEAGEEYRRIESYVYDICQKNNIILTILRPTMIYGNTTDNNVITFIKMVDKLPIMPVVNRARYQLQPVYYKDLSMAYYNVLMNETVTANKDFILSGGKAIYLRDMLNIIGAKLGKKVHYISVPFPVAYAGANLIYWTTFKKIDYREKVQRLCEPRVYSHEDASNAFGYNPVAFEEGVVDEIKEYKSEK